MDIMDARFRPFPLQFFELCSKSILDCIYKCLQCRDKSKNICDILSILSHATVYDKEADLFHVKYISLR